MAPAGSVRRYSEGAVTARHQSSRPPRSGAESATCEMHALAIDKGNSDDDCDANTSKPSSSPDAKASGVPLKVQLLNYLSVTIIVGLSYALLYLSIGDSFLPTNPAWCLYIIWVCSHLGAILIGMCRLPPLLGMLLSGILLKNLPIDLVEGLPKSWSSGVRAVGLSVILMRSGLELDYEAIKKIGWMAGRLTVLPGTSEAFLAGLVAHGLFGMPVPLAFSLGFILAAVSPAAAAMTRAREARRRGKVRAPTSWAVVCGRILGEGVRTRRLPGLGGSASSRCADHRTRDARGTGAVGKTGGSGERERRGATSGTASCMRP